MKSLVIINQLVTSRVGHCVVPRPGRGRDLRGRHGSGVGCPQPLPAIAAGDSATLSFAVDGQSRNYPEELYFAWMEPAGVRALQSGDHQTQGWSLCHDRKSMDWIQASCAEGISETDLPDGVTTMRAHLRDTDHDGRWTDRDSTDVLWVSAGRVCRPWWGPILRS